MNHGEAFHRKLELEYRDAVEEREAYEKWARELLEDKEIEDKEIEEVMPPTEEEIKEKFGDDYL